MFTDFLDSTIARNTVGEWLVALGIALGSIVAARVFYMLMAKVFKPLADKAKGRFMYIFFDMFEEPIALGLVIGGFFWAERRLDFVKATDETFSKIITFAVILDITWAIARFLDNIIDSYVVPRVEKSDSKLDDQLLPVLRKASNVVIWICGLVTAISDAGYNVGTIVAGLGIGGLAFAFAAQETIANLFGGVTVFIDSPFHMNDRIRIGGYDGWVREIGLRTAKLETLDGRRLTIPNSMFSKSVIENVSSEPATKVVETVQLARTNGADKVEASLQAIVAILASDADLQPNSTAFFGDFAESCFALTVVLWIRKDADLGAVRSRVNLAILRDLSAAKVELALPTVMIGERA